MENTSLTDLEGKLQKINKKIIDEVRPKHKYPGSVKFYREAGVRHYLQAGITNPEDINNLLDNDIWPYVVLGSRSQGQEEFSTNFNLEGYLKCGVTSPNDMLKLRNAGITPYHMRDVSAKVEFRGEMSTLVDAVVKIAQEKGYKRASAQINLDLGHELSYGKAGEELRAWLNTGR